MAENIVIPQQIYAGYTKRSDSEKLAFATYYENNAACRKRQSTIDNWRNKEMPAEILDNLPASGFKLSERVTHGGGWNDLNVFWRIIDPRGFELEISSGNLAKLFQYCSIDHGTISEDCVWGWDKGNGSKVVLLPVNSEIYKASLVSTIRHEAKSLALKDIKPGTEVELKNGLKGTFFGKVNYAYYTADDDAHMGQLKFESSYILEIHNQMSLYYVKTPKVISVGDCKKELSPKEIEDHLSSLLLKKGIISQAAGSSDQTHNTTVFFSVKEIDRNDVKLELKPLLAEDLFKTLRDEYKAANAMYDFSWALSYHPPLFMKVLDQTLYIDEILSRTAYSRQSKDSADYKFIHKQTDVLPVKAIHMSEVNLDSVEGVSPQVSEAWAKFDQGKTDKERGEWWYLHNSPIKFKPLSISITPKSDLFFLQVTYQGKNCRIHKPRIRY